MIFEKTNFTLSEKNNFKYNTLKNLFSRKNIIYYGKIVGEEPIPIESNTMKYYYSYYKQTQIRNKIQNIKEILLVI